MNKTLWTIETLEPEAIYCFITRYATKIHSNINLTYCMIEISQLQSSPERGIC